MFKIVFFILFTFLFADIFSVINVPEDYSTIQEAISAADQIDEISIAAGTYYETLDLLNKKLYIHKRSTTQVTINGGYSNIVINMGYADSSKLRGLIITGISANIGIKLDSIDNVEVKDCTVENMATGILVEECNNLKITDCVIKDNDNGIVTIDAYPSSCDLEVKSTIFHSNETAVNMNGCVSLYALSCLFYDNDLAFGMVNNRYNIAFLDRLTITDNGCGLDFGAYSYFEISNSIVYGNATNFSGSAALLDIEYSCIEGGFSGTGNIDEDPYFCNEYPFGYWLLEGSPCIDAGDPNVTVGADVRLDMGCRESFRDIKECAGEHWNWVSFPRLYREGDESVDVVPLLENFLDWDFNLQMLHDVILWANPTLEYKITENYWYPEEYFVKSSLGYKLNPDTAGYHYLPTVNGATRLPADWRLDYTLYRNEDNWMGYWLPCTQNIEAAFGEFFEYVISVSAENWYYEYSELETPSSSTANKNMVYGKGYIVVFSQNISEFYWTDATFRSLRSPQNSKPQPQYFTFTDLPNYEAIDVMEIPSNVIEIAVFEADVCVGAVVVQNEDEQILAYTTNVNRSQIPLTFEVITSGRQTPLSITDYKVLNKDTGQYEQRSLIAGQQRSSVVMFGNPEDPQNNTPALDKVVLHGNYPNPFHPSNTGRSVATTISFDITTENTESTELMIFNLKGQKVKQLVSGNLSSGEHLFTWDGSDDAGRPVSSGLYLYKLKVGDQEFIRKMLMLK
jgi:hypothetical protein